MIVGATVKKYKMQNNQDNNAKITSWALPITKSNISGERTGPNQRAVLIST
jgi:hypothetical protein